MTYNLTLTTHQFVRCPRVLYTYVGITCNIDRMCMCIRHHTHSSVESVTEHLHDSMMVWRYYTETSTDHYIIYNIKGDVRRLVSSCENDSAVLAQKFPLPHTKLRRKEFWCKLRPRTVPENRDTRKERKGGKWQTTVTTERATIRWPGFPLGHLFLSFVFER